MNKISAPTPGWIQELREQVVRGRHPFLWGNVYDHFYYQDGYASVADILRNFFRYELNYQIVAFYDSVDGLRFADEGMSAAFTNLIAQNLPTARAPATAPAPTPPVSPGQAPARGVPPARPSGGSPSQQLRIEEAVAQIRLALRQQNTSVMVHLDLADLLTGQADSYSEQERLILGQLKKCTLEAGIVDQPTRHRNTLVLTSSDLQKLPHWLHRENPIVAILAIGRPEREERRWFAQTYIEEFSGGKAVAPDERTRLLDDFADLTDGFRCWDLEALLRTSLSEAIPFKKMKTLIDFYKFGLKDDPWQKLDREKVVQASTQLTQRVLGQEAAVRAVVDMLTSARVGISLSPGSSKGGKPKGVFFFVGPTGVGKTELAKALTELVFGDERAFARFDMSEYKEEHAAEKLAGAPPGFVGYEEGGQLTNRVIKKPHSILLFDEIEKAHPRVLDKFLQILEDGRLTDGRGQTAYFHQTAIIFTSNIGASDYSDPNTGRVLRPGIMNKIGQGSLCFEEISKHFRDEVHWFFTSRIGRAELLNRLGDNIVVFDILRPQHVAGISRKFLTALQQTAEERLGLHLQFYGIEEQLEKEMSVGSNLLFGGRRVKSLLESQVERPLNRWLFEQGALDSLRGKTVRVQLAEEGGLEVGHV